MFKKILRNLKNPSEKKSAELSKLHSAKENPDKNITVPWEKDLAQTTASLKQLFKSSDVIFYEFETILGRKALLVYLNGFIDNDILNRDVLGPLLTNDQGTGIKTILHLSNIKEITLVGQASEGILDGSVLLCLNGEIHAYLLRLKKQEQRAVKEPDSESVIRGPKEGFIENIESNIVLLRRKIKSPNLMIEELTIGEQSHTRIALAYLEEIVQPEILAEVRRRLNNIKTDSILESGYIEEYLEESTYSPYPTVGNTQRPDVVAGKILEGRVAVFCDGTPHVLTIPFLYAESLQTSEDYYVRTLMGSILRLLRLAALLISTLLPALYVALSTFHQEMIPNALLLSFAGAREGIPYPTFAEILILALMFELLKESGTRLPRAIGSAISIVGALVVGEAAVSAGLVSAQIVIITSATAITSFIIPTLNEAMLVFRFLLLLLGGFLGLPGITCGIFLILTYTVSLRSFGVPYTSSLAPASTSNLKDLLVRFPLPSMKKRPDFLVKKNKNKQRRGGD